MTSRAGRMRAAAFIGFATVILVARTLQLNHPDPVSPGGVMLIAPSLSVAAMLISLLLHA